jgi:hypothetical protein
LGIDTKVIRANTRASGSSWATSWKLWTVLLLLGLLLIAVSTLLPAIRRLQAFKFFDQHHIQYELTDQNEWITETFGDHAKGFREVQAIELEGPITDESLFHVGRFRETKTLIWRHSGGASSVTEQGVSALRQLIELERITLVGPCLNNDMLAQWLSIGPPLKNVELIQFDVARPAIEAISRIQSIERLRLSHCSLDDTILINLDPLENLRELYLPGAGVGDHGATWISHSRRLTALNLASNSVSDEGLRRLAVLSELEYLTISLCPDVTDEGIAYLERLPHLAQIGLPAKSITQASISALLRMPSLTTVQVSGTINDFQLRRQMIEHWDYSDHLTHFEFR